jgi:hypothetical protein
MAKSIAFSAKLHVLLAFQPDFAGLGAFAANGGTMLAMFVFVLATFFFAGPANFNAFFHYVLGVLRIPAYKPRRKHADIGAVAVQLNAAGHHFYVVFLQA